MSLKHLPRAAKRWMQTTLLCLWQVSSCDLLFELDPIQTGLRPQFSRSNPWIKILHQRPVTSTTKDGIYLFQQVRYWATIELMKKSNMEASNKTGETHIMALSGSVVEYTPKQKTNGLASLSIYQILAVDWTPLPCVQQILGCLQASKEEAMDTALFNWKGVAVWLVLMLRRYDYCPVMASDSVFVFWDEKQAESQEDFRLDRFSVLQRFMSDTGV